MCLIMLKGSTGIYPNLLNCLQSNCVKFSGRAFYLGIIMYRLWNALLLQLFNYF